MGQAYVAFKGQSLIKTFRSELKYQRDSWFGEVVESKVTKLKLKNIFLAVSVALYASTAGIAVQAASFEETFKQAASAFKSGDFDKAGTLFEQAGDEASRKNITQAAQIWANAAVANIKAEDFKEAAEIYEKILSSKAKLYVDKQLSFSKNLAFCYGQLNERALQIKSVEKALSSIKGLSNGAKAELQATVGDAYRNLEMYSLAVDAYKKALKLTPKKDDERRAFILTAMGLCQGNLGNYDDAIGNLTQANKLAVKLKQDQTISDTFSNLGILNWEKGDYKQALSLLEQALKVEEKANFERNIGVDQNNVGLVYKSIGNYMLAMEMFNRSAEVAQKIDNPRDEGIAVVNRALVYRIQGDYARANSEYSYAVSLFQKANFKEGLAGAYLGIGKMLELQDNDQIAALDYYTKALAIYDKLELKRAQAETLLQIGELYQKDLKTVTLAQTSTEPVKGNHQAADIFNRFQSSANVQEEEEEESVSADSNASSSSGLIFEADEAEPLTSSPEEAATKSREYIEKAFAIASELGIKELLWPAHQDLGFLDYKAGNLESAYQHYATAIEIVTSIYVSGSDVEAFGEYMAGKESLYKEAQAVCAAMYQKTQDPLYLNQMQKYGDTLTNEIQKASAALSNIKFEDKKKQSQYEKLVMLQKKIAAASQNSTQIPALSDNASAEEKAMHELKTKEAKLQAEVVKQAESDYEKAFAEWKKAYPGDTLLFEAASRVDIPTIQKHITPEQTVLMYTQLPETLLVTIIKNDSVLCQDLGVPQAKVEEIIRNKFVVGYIEDDKDGKKTIPGFARNFVNFNEQTSWKYLQDVSKLLHELYGYYIAPIAQELEGSKRLYIVNDGIGSQLPFGALVKDFAQDGNPNFLIEEYEIGIIRPSFIQAFTNDAARKNVKKMLAVANPANFNFQMPLLAGTIDEIANARNNLHANQSQIDIASEIMYDEYSGQEALEHFSLNFPEAKNGKFAEPTESWLRKQLASNGYELVYFSTHGMPHSNTKTSVSSVLKSMQKRDFSLEAFIKEYRADPKAYEANHQERNSKGRYTDYYMAYPERVRLAYTSSSHLPSNSPLNGFLYLSSEDDTTSVLTTDIPHEQDGLLTMKEILEMPDSYFANTQYVFLSACNTGVTYAPIAFVQDLDQETTPEEVKKELDAQGLVPGVDQVSFVDTFMRRGVKNVYGTFWFVDDAMSSELMTRFMINLQDKEKNLDAVGAFNAAQRELIALGKHSDKYIYEDYNKDPKNKETQRDGYFHPQHPFFWAAGAIFGK